MKPSEKFTETPSSSSVRGHKPKTVFHKFITCLLCKLLIWKLHLSQWHILSLMYISVATSTAGETVLHIFKRRMGLTKRGSHDNEALTVSNVSVHQTDNFTVHETSGFVELIIPTAQILQTKVRAETTGGASCVMQFGQFLTFVKM